MKELYDKSYFFSECEGFKEFLSSGGIKLSRRLSYIYGKIYAYKPNKILDMGSGRGELALAFALTGWESYGADYSSEALEISSRLKEKWIKNSPDMKLKYVETRVENLPFENNFFDAVVMSDLVEHLSESSLDLAFSEALRVLKKDGRLFIHTSPNAIFLKWGLLLYKILGLINGLNMPENMRAALPRGLSKDFHINEQTVFSLKSKLKKAGFEKVEFEFKKNPHYVYYFLKEDKYIRILNKIYKFLPIKHLFFADIFAQAQK
ncbi:MAG: class I SAM-dependent methyltransferase [Elusimicrobia bacterium]|nr:class I SAM-dependent methyltransferase [Elusimicrobiota bacterium]